MTKSRIELAAALDALQARLPSMIAQYDDDQVMEAFAGEAELFETGVAAVDQVFVRDRLQCMLRDAGLIPGDDEPCSA